MGGVDNADQDIFNYRPDLRCMPIFLNFLNIMRVDPCLEKRMGSLPRKAVTNDFITSRSTKCLNERAVVYKSGVTMSQAAVTDPPGSGQQSKCRRKSHTDPQLPPRRFDDNPSDHRHEISSLQKRYIYCNFVLAQAKKEGRKDHPKVREPSR